MRLIETHETSSFFFPLLHNLKTKIIMEAMLLTTAQFDAIITRIETLMATLEKKAGSSHQTIIDNKTFHKMMGVSQRTGQLWRDEGKIAFSQVGNKIYYKMEDIEKFLEEHHNNTFAK